LPSHRRAGLGLARTYQITNLFPRLSALDNCLLAVQALLPVKLHLLRAVTRYPHLFERATAVLESVGLGAKRDEAVRNLSHGEQRQLEIGWPWPARRASFCWTSLPRACPPPRAT
jgi:branched-chain amino acid transport system ATP-binding protein